MKRKHIFQAASLVGVILFAACGADEETTIDTTHTPPPAIDITAVTTVLPQAGNVALLESSCVPCHSLRYIEMQPKLSLKAWEKIVDKMIKTYGAPVRDSATRQDIINYLHAIKGEK